MPTFISGEAQGTLMAVDTLDGTVHRFEAADGVQLTGMLAEPRKKAKTALIALHGMGGFFWDHALLQASDAARKAGIAFFSFNNRGLGMTNSLKKRTKTTKKYLLAGTSFERFEDCVKDIDGAIAFLRKQGYKRFILCGHSTGCQKITYYQSKKNNPAVKGIVLLGPADDRNSQDMLLKGKLQQCVRKAKQLMDAGKGDQIMPASCQPQLFSARRFYAIYEPKSTEGNLFDYTKKLTALSNIRCPVFAAFGKDEEFAVIPPRAMLERIREACRSKKSRTLLAPGNHSFRGGEAGLIRALAGWLREVR